nr:hypothetical protein [Tanacetum cinerariifolium]
MDTEKFHMPPSRIYDVYMAKKTTVNERRFGFARFLNDSHLKHGTRRLLLVLRVSEEMWSSLKNDLSQTTTLLLARIHEIPSKCDEICKPETPIAKDTDDSTSIHGDNSDSQDNNEDDLFDDNYGDDT